MNAFLSLPDWAPGWLGPVLVILGALFALAFLLMPFTVFSLKSRLDQIELKLEDIHADLNSLGAPAGASRSHYAWPDAAPRPPDQPPPTDRYPVRPPIPPTIPERNRQEARPAEARPQRSEPKLDWPR